MPKDDDLTDEIWALTPTLDPLNLKDMKLKGKRKQEWFNEGGKMVYRPDISSEQSKALQQAMEDEGN